jgi:hypothetical protein
MSGARQDKGRKIIMKRLVRGEKGYVLIAALVVLLVLGLISGPLLSYMVSGLKAGHVFETGAAELYGADAGVQDAVWRIQNNIGLCVGHNTTYTISDVNGKSIDVTVTLTNNVTGALTYKITSTAVTYDGGNTAALASGTTVESYLQFTPGGDLPIFSGALASRTDIQFNSHGSVVNGDIYYGRAIKGDFTQNDGNQTVIGSGGFPTQDENVAFANLFKDEAQEGQTYGNLSIDSSQSLGPAYIMGDLDITGNDVTLTLTGTIYVEGSIKASKDYTLMGSGSIVAVHDIYLSKISSYGTDGSSIIMSLEGGITFKKEGTVDALVYAPNGAISFDKNAIVTGGVVGDSIVVDKDATLTYVPQSGFDFPGGLPGAYAIETYDVSRLS